MSLVTDDYNDRRAGAFARADYWRARAADLEARLPEPVDHYQSPADEYDGFPVLKGVALGVAISLVLWLVLYEAGRAWGVW